jgi:hypothetical protein
MEEAEEVRRVVLEDACVGEAGSETASEGRIALDEHETVGTDAGGQGAGQCTGARAEIDHRPYSVQGHLGRNPIGEGGPGERDRTRGARRAHPSSIQEENPVVQAA